MSCGVELERLELPKMQKVQTTSAIKRKSSAENTRQSQKMNKKLKIELAEESEAEPLSTGNVAVVEERIKKIKTPKKQSQKFRSYSVTMSPGEATDGLSSSNKLKIRFRKIEDDSSRDFCEVDHANGPKCEKDRRPRENEPEIIADVSTETAQGELKSAEFEKETVETTDGSQEVILSECSALSESTNSFESMLQVDKILKGKMSNRKEKGKMSKLISTKTPIEMWNHKNS